MRDVLGYGTYGAHGGDLGAGVTTRLGAAHPESVPGIHLSTVADPPLAAQTRLTPEEQIYLAQRQECNVQEGGYQHQQQTRPVTLA
jgi:pimeloyl-ACP methyl ester carboxylesterase